MKILQSLCSVPTAPFAEDAVVRYVEAFVRARKNLRLSRDTSGNLLIELKTKSIAKSPRWIFAAHMDHPGFIAKRMIDSKTLEAHFRGWVMPTYFPGSKVRFFSGDREITGTISSFILGKDRAVPSLVKIRIGGDVPPGTAGMWDQGEGRTKDGKFFSRVCDDLAGAAGALSMIDALHKKPPKTPIAVLLTRAEEEGFVGAMAAVLKPELLRKSDRIIAIECSAMQPYAPQGKGAIIRIGDRTSVFNSAISYFITQRAEELKKKHKDFQFQRALMPGGTCEATVYDIYGYMAGSICVALGNYHNMDTKKKKIAPEFIDVNDYQSMVKLFIHIAQTGHTFEPGHGALRARLEKRFKKLERLLG